MPVDFKYLPFGMEAEFTGMPRKRSAEICAAYFGTEVEKDLSQNYPRGCQRYDVKDENDRIWKLVYEDSVFAEPSRYTCRVELVSPICQYEDLTRIKFLVMALKQQGLMKVNPSCGFHVHVDGALFDAKTLRNLVNLVAGKEALLYKALQVDDKREQRFCKKVNREFLEAINEGKPDTLEAFRDIWYSTLKAECEYPEQTRYYGLNLHSFFTNGSIEYRMFNGTCEPERINAMIILSLAMSAYALNREQILYRKTEPTQEKRAFSAWLSQLGLVGKEFQKTRRLLVENLGGKPDVLDLKLQKQLSKDQAWKQIVDWI